MLAGKTNLVAWMSMLTITHGFGGLRDHNGETPGPCDFRDSAGASYRYFYCPRSVCRHENYVEKQNAENFNYMDCWYEGHGEPNNENCNAGLLPGQEVWNGNNDLLFRIPSSSEMFMEEYIVCYSTSMIGKLDKHQLQEFRSPYSVFEWIPTPFSEITICRHGYAAEIPWIDLQSDGTASVYSIEQNLGDDLFSYCTYMLLTSNWDLLLVKTRANHCTELQHCA